MDKELVRVIIIFVGLVVIAGMIVWGMVKNRRTERKSFYGEKYEDDEVDIVPLGSALDDEPFDTDRDYSEEDDEALVFSDDYDEDYADERPTIQRRDRYNSEPAASSAETAALPEIIQFGVVSKELQGFNGMQLAVAFKSAGLTYGTMKIFEYVDAAGDAVFNVASINEPGTFPDTELDKFNCPGIVFFMQPEYLADPVAVFDQMVATVHKLAKQLDGVEWDQKRRPLTEATIAALREQLF